MKSAALSALALLLAASPLPAQTTSAPSPQLHLPWDYSLIIGTGQSLSVGARGEPVLSTSQHLGNLQLSTGNLPWPIDPDNPALHLVPLVEPIGRHAHSFPSAWPDNIDGETPHTAMADQLSTLVRDNFHRPFVSIHAAVGEDGQGMIYLRKHPQPNPINGHSYQAALTETKAITRLVIADHKSLGVGAIVITHGESDCGNAHYENELFQLWSDYNTDLRAITAQHQNILMILSQQNSLVDFSPSTVAQWKIGLDHPADIVCSGPKYQYPYANDRIHLTPNGYRELGEKYAQVYYERLLLNHDWQPLQPTSIDHHGPTLTIHFNVPVPPLAWDTSMDNPHPSIKEWANAKGFEITTADGKRVPIHAAEITPAGDAVTLTCESDPAPGDRLSYAMVAEPTPMKSPYPGTVRWGQLKDSDPFTGADTHAPQPNYCVAFQLPIP
ncbi:MAG: dockerin [Phycisphaerae bacterium]